MTPEQKRVALAAHFKSQWEIDPRGPLAPTPKQIGDWIIDMLLHAQALDQASQAPALDTTPPDEAKAQQGSFSDAWERWRVERLHSYSYAPGEPERAFNAIAKHFFEAGQRATAAQLLGKDL